jgi:hypothetical protein
MHLTCGLSRDKVISGQVVIQYKARLVKLQSSVMTAVVEGSGHKLPTRNKTVRIIS